MAEIYERMAAIMAEAPVVSKGQKNRDQGFMFRGIDDLYAALHMVMAKHKVFCMSSVIGVERYEGHTKNGTAFVDAVLTIGYTFYAPDGSSVSTQSVGVGRDYADKYASKAMAIAHKYALVQAFLIPTDEPDMDPDASTISGPATKTEPVKQMTDEQRNEILYLIESRKMAADDRKRIDVWLGKPQTADAARKTINFLKNLEEAGL